METRTQIVTQLVAAMISAGFKSADWSGSVAQCVELADYIISQTTEEIPFPETVI